MKRTILMMILISAFCFAAFGQADENLCPKIELITPNHLLPLDEQIIFSVKTDEIAKKYNLNYEWTVSTEKILQGQGTSKIVYLANEEDESTNLKISVKIIGLPENCQNTYSDILGFMASPIGEPVNSFGRIDINEYKSRLDSFFSYLGQNPDSEGLIELRFDRKDKRDYKISRLKEIVKFLDFRNYDKRRITFAIIDGDFELTELWIVPPGARFPKSRTADYKRISEETYQIIKAEELLQKINQLFPKK